MHHDQPVSTSIFPKKLLLIILALLFFSLSSYSFFTSGEKTALAQVTYPEYSPAEVLLEEVGGSTAPLTSAFVPEADTAGRAFRHFSIIQEGDTFYLYIADDIRDTSGRFTSVERRYESQDGLIWHNRTDTNLAITDTFGQLLSGLRQIIKTGDSYQAWEHYYQSGTNLRYLTSDDGLNWTVVNQPALIRAQGVSVIKQDTTYHMWANPSLGDVRPLRYRTSSNPGSGWGDWQTGGSLVKVDGSKEVTGWSRVREQADGSYKMYYLDGSWVNIATSEDGINFTTQIGSLFDAKEVLPLGDGGAVGTFEAIEVGDKTWFYFTYCNTATCDQPFIAVVRPLAPETSNLTIIKQASIEHDFVFSGIEPDQTFSLRPNTEQDRQTFTIEPGKYTIKEDPSSFPDNLWALLSVSCQGNSIEEEFSGIDNEAYIELSAGENVTCTFFNERSTISQTTHIYLPMVINSIGDVGSVPN